MRFFNKMFDAVKRPLSRLECDPELPDLFSLTVATSKTGGAAAALTGRGGALTFGSAAVWADDVTAGDAATNSNSFPMKCRFRPVPSIMIGTMLFSGVGFLKDFGMTISRQQEIRKMNLEVVKLTTTRNSVE